MFSKRDLCRCCQKEYQPKEHSSDSFSERCRRGKPSVGGGKEPSEVSSSSSSSRCCCCCCCSSIESADKQNEVESEREIPFFSTVSLYEKKNPCWGGLFSKVHSCNVFLKRTPAGWNIYIFQIVLKLSGSCLCRNIF